MKEESRDFLLEKTSKSLTSLVEELSKMTQEEKDQWLADMRRIFKNGNFKDDGANI